MAFVCHIYIFAVLGSLPLLTQLIYSRRYLLFTMDVANDIYTLMNIEQQVKKTFYFLLLQQA